MSSFQEGSAATCGICSRDTTISVITERTGGKSYDLACKHRNAECPTCGSLVRDDSDTIFEVRPLCRTCNPDAFADDDDE